MKIKKATKMLNENNYLVTFVALDENKKKNMLCFAKNEKMAKVKAYDKYGRRIKFLEVTKL